MRRRSAGGAAVETAAAALIGAALLSGSLYVGRAAFAARRAHALARHAAWLSAAGVAATDIEAESADHAARLGAPGARLALRRHDALPAARFYRLAEAQVSIDVARPRLAGPGALTVRASAAVEEERP